MLQSGADQRDSLQVVEAQVQLHQACRIEDVGRQALVRELVVGHPKILQLCQSGQEALRQRSDGVGVQVELVQSFGESLWHLRGVRGGSEWRLEVDTGSYFVREKSHTPTLTFDNLLPLTSNSVRDVRDLSDAPMSVIALSWRWRIVRLSIPSRSKGVT